MFVGLINPSHLHLPTDPFIQTDLQVRGNTRASGLDLLNKVKCKEINWRSTQVHPAPLLKARDTHCLYWSWVAYWERWGLISSYAERQKQYCQYCQKDSWSSNMTSKFLDTLVKVRDEEVFYVPKEGVYIAKREGTSTDIWGTLLRRRWNKTVCPCHDIFKEHPVR